VADDLPDPFLVAYNVMYVEPTGFDMELGRPIDVALKVAQVDAAPSARLPRATPRTGWAFLA